MAVVERLEPGTQEWEQWMPDHMARYLLAADMVRDRVVLDAGTGAGYGASILKGAGARSVQAVDISESALSQARQHFASDGIEFILDDCHELKNVKGPFDVICNFENLEHLERPQDFLKVAARHLNDDGVFLCSTPDRATKPEHINGKPANPYHMNEWYRDEFIALLKPYFAQVELKIQVQTSTSVRRQDGTYALQAHLEYLWNNPLLRVTRAMSRLLGQQKREWPSIDMLAAATMADFPIVNASVAPLLGATLCHFAVCSKPKR